MADAKPQGHALSRPGAEMASRATSWNIALRFALITTREELEMSKDDQQSARVRARRRRHHELGGAPSQQRLGRRRQLSHLGTSLSRPQLQRSQAKSLINPGLLGTHIEYLLSKV